MPTPYIAALAVTAVMALSSCATAPRTSATHETACADPLYVRLKAIHPDSLSEREYGRLRDLEAACQIEKQASAQPQHHGGGMMSGSRWYLMPVMVLVAAGMGLMMGRW